MSLHVTAVNPCEDADANYCSPYSTCIYSKLLHNMTCHCLPGYEDASPDTEGHSGELCLCNAVTAFLTIQQLIPCYSSPSYQRFANPTTAKITVPAEALDLASCASTYLPVTYRKRRLAPPLLVKCPLPVLFLNR